MGFKNLYFLCFGVSFSHAVSIVYNLKIAEITKRQTFEERFSRPNTLALTGVEQFRETYDSRRQNIAAALGTYIYSPKNTYFRVDAAVGNVRQKCGPLPEQTTFHKTQTDDILFSFGHTFVKGKQTRATVSLLLGVPTHRDFLFYKGLQFGTGHVGFGGQFETSHAYWHKQLASTTIIGALRFIHFFPRCTCIPLLEQNFDFGLGNIVDLFIAHLAKFRKNRIEFGYNPTFAFNAYINPRVELDSLLESSSFIRSSFYIAYKRIFLIHEHPSAITTAFSYGFDHRPKTVGVKNQFTFWTSWGINF
jgi:hypothetical protein